MLWYDQIPNPQWQYVFGLIAAYGISNHELFYLDLDSLQRSPGHLVSSYRKAHYGVRNIWCLYPEWYEKWELYKPKSQSKSISKPTKDGSMSHKKKRCMKY